jgi:hypothetical protein
MQLPQLARFEKPSFRISGCRLHEIRWRSSLVKPSFGFPNLSSLCLQLSFQALPVLAQRPILTLEPRPHRLGKCSRSFSTFFHSESSEIGSPRRREPRWKVAKFDQS